MFSLLFPALKCWAIFGRPWRDSKTAEDANQKTVAYAPSLPHRRRRQRIVGPRMTWVAAAEFSANDGIGVGPEAGQVVGDLLWPIIRSQQVQQHGDSAASDSRGFAQAEDFLNAHGQDRRPADFVFQRDAAAAGNGQMRSEERRVGKECRL